MAIARTSWVMLLESFALGRPWHSYIFCTFVISRTISLEEGARLRLVALAIQMTSIKSKKGIINAYLSAWAGFAVSNSLEGRKGIYKICCISKATKTTSMDVTEVD